MEHDNFVHAIEKLRAEVIAHFLQHGFFHTIVSNSFESPLILENPDAPDVGSHNNDRILEIDCPALPIGQSAIVQNLQQYVEDVAMGFLDLIKQDHGIGAPSNGLGELTAYFISDIAWRRSDKASDGMFLLIFRHIDPYQC